MTRKNRILELDQPLGAISPTDGQEAEARSFAPEDQTEESRPEEIWPADGWLEDDEPHHSPLRGWIAPALALIAIAGWSMFFIYARSSAMAEGASPDIWVTWVVQWSIPVILIVSLWLLAMRTSQREAHRFAMIGQSLRAEADMLEARLATVNRDLSTARDFLGAQSRELESLGRIASERISNHADRLQDMVSTNSSQLETIERVSGVALSNMNRLKDDLPVIGNSARDVSNQIGNAGCTARDNLHELASSFEELNRAGETSQHRVASIRAQVAETLAGFEAQTTQMENLARTRFAAMTEQSDAFRTEMDQREIEALAAMRHRADRLDEELRAARDLLESEEEEALKSLQSRVNAIREGAATVSRAMQDSQAGAASQWQEQTDKLKLELGLVNDEVERLHALALDTASDRLIEFDQQAVGIDDAITQRNTRFTAAMDAHQQKISALEAASLEQMETRLAAIDNALTERRDAHLAQTQIFTEQAEAILARFSAMRSDMETIAHQGHETESCLATGLELLATRLQKSRAALDATGETIENLHTSGEALLDLLRTTANLSRDDLAISVENTAHSLGNIGTQAQSLDLMLGEAGRKGQELSGYVLETRSSTETIAQSLDRLHAQFTQAQNTHAAALEALSQQLETLNESSEALSDKAGGDLKDALQSLQLATQQSLAALETGSSEGIRTLARKIGAEAAEEIDRAVLATTQLTIGQLEQSSIHAASLGKETVVQLRDQLARVNELTANLESRVERARDRAEEKADNDFSRRVALLTEALNSNAIDISKALSTEVSDTAWTHYLRGDRSIFSRRAVRLLDNTEAREIAEIYDTDPDFREHVSRYIHDFEAMLRTMLSTRDGNALGVTLLSSDIGKLYVVLAQAIERLRD
ncbi:MAG: ATPase [Sphingomonadaceae bacterium]